MRYVSKRSIGGPLSRVDIRPRRPVASRPRGDDRLLPRGRLRADQQLRRDRRRCCASAGHRVVFIVEESFAGHARGAGLRGAADAARARRPRAEEAPGQFWKDFIRETAPVFRKPTIEQLGEFIAPTFEALMRRRALRRRAAARDHRRARAGRDRRGQRRLLPGARGQRAPWVRIVSCNPLEVKDPACRRCSPATRRTTAPAGRSSGAEYRRTHADLHGGLRRVLPRARRAAAARGCEFIARVAVPEPLRLPGARSTTARARPLGARWHRLEASVRATDGALELPGRAPPRRRGLALPLPRLARLGRRRADAAAGRHASAATPHRVIVSKGPQHEQIELADNMCGEGFLPQPAILPQVDLVITHGGNNTTPRPALRQADGRRCRSSGISTTTRSACTRRASAPGLSTYQF